MRKLMTGIAGIVAFVAAVVSLICFILPYCQGMILPVQVEVTSLPYDKVSKSGAALYKIITRTKFVKKKGAEGSFGVVVFVRPVPEPYFFLQCKGWPPQAARYCYLKGTNVCEEECVIDPIYVGNWKTCPHQNQFEIYAVVLKRSVINKLMLRMTKDTGGLPFLDQMSKIRDFDPNAIISVPTLLNVNWSIFEEQVSVVNPYIEGVGNISPDDCTFRSPCFGLERGSKLYLEIQPRGYAAGYLKDRGFYYNQEGRLIINNGTEGNIRLWPGTSEHIGSRYELYVVTSYEEIPTFPDSEKLEELPKGNKWGPIYLHLRNEIDDR